MNVPDRSPTKEKLLTALTVLTVLAYFVVFALINFRCFAYFCEPDMYADTPVSYTHLQFTSSRAVLPWPDTMSPALSSMGVPAGRESSFTAVTE